MSVEQAKDFLREKQEGGKMASAAAATEEAKAIGISEASLRRAKGDLGVQSFQQATNTGERRWLWSLEPSPASVGEQVSTEPPTGDSQSEQVSGDAANATLHQDPAPAANPNRYAEEHRSRSAINYLCSECGTGHPVPDKAAGERHEDAHNRAVAAAQVSR